MRRTKSLGGADFEALYRADPDPWGFSTSPYEAAKYDRTLAVAGERPARRALEMGCSIGVLTRRLAPLCDRLVATEVSPTALAQARERCAGLPNVDFVLAGSVAEGIDGAFDLMLLSELVYYWDDDDLATVAAAIARSLAADGRILLVHWLGETDYPRSADDAVGALKRRLDPVVEAMREVRTDDYRLDLWRRRPGSADLGEAR